MIRDLFCSLQMGLKFGTWDMNTSSFVISLLNFELWNLHL